MTSNMSSDFQFLVPESFHKKFGSNRPAGSGEDFRWVFTIYGRGGYLGHVTSIMSSDFHFLVAESFHTTFGSDQHSNF